ncbi:TIGR03826 family flagellar region protein [Oceanobacillus salinisoli]|uniref:TIGR03826 family flagellar region protein n=1 Tax=Oceanobacillus salinisoli TaxID=2678611 RepID=UPI0012E1D184|nr:TIGR03826 family flagellar region protein [Oceanobacillus salinisoli]
MAELANCVRCESVFVKGLRDICQDCYKEEEKAFQTVNEFLRDRNNRKASMLDIVEATGVEDWYITKFIKEKRLLLSRFPNLAYSCKGCGNDITSGKLCKNCQEKIIKDLKTEEELENKSEERHRKEKAAANTYYTLDKQSR